MRQNQGSVQSCRVALEVILSRRNMGSLSDLGPGLSSGKSYKPISIYEASIEGRPRDIAMLLLGFSRDRDQPPRSLSYSFVLGTVSD